jgi:hypothetical protein
VGGGSSHRFAEHTHRVGFPYGLSVTAVDYTVSVHLTASGPRQSADYWYLPVPDRLVVQVQYAALVSKYM